MVKPKLFLLLTYFGVISLAGAQEITPLSQKDSAEYLVALAAKKMESSPQQAEALIRRGYTHAVEAKYVAGQGKALFALGRMLRTVNKNEEAIDAYLKAARLFESLKDSSRAGRAYNGAAGIYIYKLYHHTKAYAYCTKAAALLQHDSISLPSALSNLAALHLQTGKFDDALEIYKKSYEAEQRNNNLTGMCTSLNNIATAYDSKKDFKSSVVYYKKALEISRALGDHKNTAHILLGLAPIYCDFNEQEKAREALDEVITLSEKHSLFDKKIPALQYLADQALRLGNVDKAMTYSLQSMRIADEHGLHMFKGSIYKQLSDICKKKGNHAQALHFNQKYALFQDSLANQERLAVASLDLTKNDNPVASEDTGGAAFPRGWMIAVSMGIVIPGMFFIFYKKRMEKEPLQDQKSMAYEQPLQDRFDENKQVTDNNNIPETVIQHLEVINGEGIKLLALNNIWWFQKEEKSYHAFTENGNYRVRQNITELEQALPKNRFFRINRAVIINIDQMSNYSFWENHKYIIRMKDVKKSEFIISRSRLREMKDVFQVLEGS